MALAKKKFREIILQLLYSSIFGALNQDDIVSMMMKQIKTTKKNILLAINCVIQIKQFVDEFDVYIKNTSKAYDLNRISKVELCILHLALYEMKYDKSIPYKVAISESIRLTKKFSSKHSVSFVNAILDSIYSNYGFNKE